MQPALALAVAVVLAPALAAQAQAPVRINATGDNSNPGQHFGGASVAASDSRFLAVWVEQFGTSSSTKDIYAAYSDDGSAWSTPQRVDLGDGANATDSEQPKVVVTSNGHFHVFWEDARGSGSGSEDVLYARSGSGSSWNFDALTVNTSTAGGASDVDFIHAAANGNDLHVTWEDDAINGGDVDEIRYARSLDNGNTWVAPMTLQGFMGVDADDPKVVVFGTTVIVAWIDDAGADDNVKLRRSTNNGQTFGSTVSVESDTAGDVDEVLIAASDSVVVVAWLDDDPAAAGGNSVHAVLSTDGGVTWSAEEDLSPRTSLEAGSRVADFDLAVRGPDIHVLFATDATLPIFGGGGVDKVLRSGSINAGDTWSKDFWLAPGGTTPQAKPAVVADTCGVWTFFGNDADGQNGLTRARSVFRGFGTWPATETALADGDFETQLDSRTIAVRQADHTMVCVYWDSVGGSNELFGAAYLGCTPVSTFYCTAGTSSEGCVPTLNFNGIGVASATNASGFTLISDDLPGQRAGIFFYGLSGRQASAWGAGTSYLCLKAPTQRMSAMNSGGTPAVCDGVIQQDWNTFRANNPTALGSPFVGGEVVGAQCWYRDPASPKTTGLTNALEFVVQP